MECKILFNFFNEDEDTKYTDFTLDVNSVNGFYFLELNNQTALVAIIAGTEYALLYTRELHSRLKQAIESKQKYNLN